MLMGPSSTESQRSEFREKVKANPRNYVAQPVVTLSACPTWTEEGIAPRHVDLRLFVLHGAEVVVPPVALSRVALESDALVVNSSQGGGSKDTWICG